MKTSMEYRQSLLLQRRCQACLTEDFIGLDGAKWDKSSVSCADSSFAKGAIGAFGERKSVADTVLKSVVAVSQLQRKIVKNLTIFKWFYFSFCTSHP